MNWFFKGKSGRTSDQTAGGKSWLEKFLDNCCKNITVIWKAIQLAGSWIEILFHVERKIKNYILFWVVQNCHDSFLKYGKFFFLKFRYLEKTKTDCAQFHQEMHMRCA